MSNGAAHGRWPRRYELHGRRELRASVIREVREQQRVARQATARLRVRARDALDDVPGRLEANRTDANEHVDFAVDRQWRGGLHEQAGGPELERIDLDREPVDLAVCRGHLTRVALARRVLDRARMSRAMSGGRLEWAP
jgi:hypothetical protein